MKLIYNTKTDRLGTTTPYGVVEDQHEYTIISENIFKTFDEEYFIIIDENGQKTLIIRKTK